MNSPMGRRRQLNSALPPRMHQKGGAFYYVTSTTPRRWLPLGSDIADARLKWAEIENGPKDASILAVLIDDWLASADFASLASSSKKCYSAIARRAKVFFEGAKVGEIRPHHIAAWMDAHPSKTQANLGRALLTNTFKLAVRRGIVDRNPVTEIKRHAIPKRTRYITDEEFKAIRSAAHPVLRAAMDISYVTAARISDILAIRLANIGPDGLLVRQIKTKKLQIFQCSPQLEAVIASAKTIPRPVRGLYLLCTQKGQPYSYATINQWWQEAVARAGVRGAVFHDIRGKSATDAKQDGVDYQALLGHSTKAMSDRYIKIDEAQKVDVLQRKI